MDQLAAVLGLDRRELFMLANPQAMELLRPPQPDKKKLAWEEFRKDGQFRRTHQITSDEMELLSSVPLLLCKLDWCQRACPGNCAERWSKRHLLVHRQF